MLVDEESCPLLFLVPAPPPPLACRTSSPGNMSRGVSARPNAPKMAFGMVLTGSKVESRYQAAGLWPTTARPSTEPNASSPPYPGGPSGNVGAPQTQLDSAPAATPSPTRTPRISFSESTQVGFSLKLDNMG